MKAKFLALAALVLGLASCQTDPQDLDVTSGGEQAVTINVAIPEEVTRAAGSDSALGGIGNVDLAEYDIRYILEVYDENGALAKDRMYQRSDDTSANFNLRLIPGRAYRFVVWADFIPQTQAADEWADYHYNTEGGLRTVTLNSTWDAIDESRDAYTGIYDVDNFSSTSTINMTLTRPFAKLRVVTDDILQMVSARPQQVTIKYFSTNFYTTFDAFEEKAKNAEAYTTPIVVDLTNDTYDKEDPEKTGVQTLFADYFFGAEDDRVMFTMDVQDNTTNTIPTITFNTNIPVERNNLTTIYGPILTDANNVSVTINPAFDNGTNWNPGDDQYDVEVWDGKSVKEPAKNAEGNYIIKTPSELAWLAAAVNGTLNEEYTRATTVAANDFSGKTFILSQDINLGNEPWTPIGSNGNIFKGTFDGNNKKIANLVVNGYNSNAGLFGVTHDGEIKNLVVENAKVAGRLNVGVVAGTPYTSKYTNVTVQGHVEVNGMAYVGGVGGKNAYADWTNITVNVDETSYVKANSVEDGTAYRTYVGGVVGFNGEGGHKFSNISSNINVQGSTCDVGGLFGIAHYGNQFEDCSCSGDVEIYAAEEAAEAEEIGGIAGVWNNGGADVVFTNCTFTGTLTTNIAVDFYYGGLVGKPYSETGTGKLIIDGYEMVVNGLGVNDEGECLVTATEGLEYIAEQVNAGNEEYTKANIVLDGDIDLAELAAMTRSSAVANNWTPIGTKENPFTGTFDGNGNTIKNLALVESEAKEGKAFVGFFGYAKDATIKNVTFENVYINIPCLDIDHSQGHIGAVAGSLEGTSTIENVTVKGDVKVYATQDANGASRVAVIAGGNSYGNVTMKNVHVIANEGSYLIANNNTGALAGQLQGKSLFENCSSNIDVTVNKFFAGGIIGIAAGDQTFINCHTTGDIAVVAGREGRNHDQYRVGGIAGGWADGATKVCTLTNCSYTGNVSGKNSDGSVANPLDYMGYVGRGYTLNGCQGSKVVIDGVEFVQKYNTAAEAGIYDIANLEISSKADMFWFAQMVNSNKCTFAGQTVKLAADIDLNNEEWTPIGSAYMDHGFMGNFDGNGKVIKNLKITNIAPDSDGYVYAGLFGVTEGIDKDNQNYIKNLTIENVNIKTTGHIVAAAIAYPYYTNLENIKVQGNVAIEGGDYTSGVLAYTRRCVDAKNIAIEANNGVIKGNMTIGGVISDIQMNGGLTANYSNFAASGLTIEGVMHVGGISGILSKQILNGVTVENVAIVCDDARKGIVSGSLGEDSTLKDVVVNNVTGADYYVGATYKAGSTHTLDVDGVVYEYLANGQIKVDGSIIVANGVILNEAEEYIISNAAGMFWFANEVNVNKNAFNGKIVKLAANIDLENAAWTPVGQTGATTFNGVFDGQNYTISNLNVNSEAQTGAHYSSGLFGWVESHTAGHGHIKNVKINGATINGHHNCGALVGYITQQTALVENCHVTGATVTCTKANNDADGDKAGALIGNATVATPVKDCTAANSTVSAGRDAGQVIGAGREANVTGCSATDVTVSANGTGTGANVRNEVIGRLL